MASKEILGPDSFGGSDFLFEDEHGEYEPTLLEDQEKPMANAGYPWWIAVYVPHGALRNATNIFKITRVDRFQAQDKDLAYALACRKQEWKLVSIAREEMVVY